MQVDLAEQIFLLAGGRHRVAGTIGSTLQACGATVSWHDPDSPAMEADGLILCYGLDPTHDSSADEPLLAFGERQVQTMAKRGRGCVVHIVSALGLVPMRRHARFSQAQARIIAIVRTQAMIFAPKVRVNGVAAGIIGGDGGLAAGDPAMLGHVALGRAGAVDDVAHAVLFLCDPMNSYTTGQILAVDGGWTAGYARNF